MPGWGEILRLRFALLGMTCGGNNGRGGGEIGRWEGVFHGGMVAGGGIIRNGRMSGGAEEEGIREFATRFFDFASLRSE